MHRVIAFLFFLTIPCSVFGTEPTPVEYDWGPFAFSYEDVHGHDRKRFVGPFVEHADTDPGFSYRAYRPLWSRVERTHEDFRRVADVLWPISTRRTMNDGSTTRVLLFYHMTFGANDPERDRTWLIPFFFSGTSKEGKEYMALFPIGGNIYEFFTRDRISFFLWPLWVSSSINDVHSTSYLWPFISKTEGEGIDRFRIFPLYAHSITDGQYRKRSILWPFWNDVRYDYDDNKGGGFILFPLFGHMDLPDQKTIWLVPPFIRFTKGEKRSMVNCPWPFIQYASGDMEKFYIWPLWGRRQFGAVDSSFLLWPIFTRSTVKTDQYDRHVWNMFPIIASDRTEIEGGAYKKPNSAHIERRYFRFWPLAEYRREGDQRRFRALALYPKKDAPRVDRNFAPFWTLYESTAMGEGNKDVELLWGLFRRNRRDNGFARTSVFPLFEIERHEEENEGGSWQLLKGLVGRERRGTHTSWRLLYFLHLGDEEE